MKFRKALSCLEGNKKTYLEIYGTVAVFVKDSKNLIDK